MQATSREEERTRAVRSGSDGGVPIRPRQARAGRRIWAGLARVCRPGPFFFFQLFDFPLFANTCKIQKCIKIILCIQKL
jgi:hypothetical protein